MNRGTGGPPIARTSSHTPASEARAAPPRVLLAEDHDDARRALTSLLRADGWHVVAVGDGGAALEALARAADGGTLPFDAVLLDFVMPGLSGIGILNAMRRFGRQPPTFVTTAFPDRNVETMARRLGAIEVLRKPLDVDRLSALLATPRRPAARQA